MPLISSVLAQHFIGSMEDFAQHRSSESLVPDDHDFLSKWLKSLNEPDKTWHGRTIVYIAPSNFVRSVL